jgi:GT2 family glycosyltransferase
MPDNYQITVVNDGADFDKLDLTKLQNEKKFDYIHNKTNIGVGKSKNLLFRSLLKADCEHIFLVEDDIVIKNYSVFEKYIDARNITGIQHFNFGYHGPANKAGISGGKPEPRFVVDYGDVQIAINQHSVGAFCYYTREVLEKVGLIDEDFHNAFEHVEHDYRIAKGGYCTPYWNWPDLANSMDYLDEIECSEKSSAIRPRKDWQENIQKGAELFLKKHGVLPAWQNAVPDTTIDQVKKIMKEIYKKYAIRS